MTVDTILMIVVVFLVLIGLLMALVQTIRHRPTIGPITISLWILGLAFGVFLTYRGRDLESADLGQIILMTGLVIITALYAHSTQKMAEEMREQRYAALKPIVEIRHCGWAKNRMEFNISIENIGLGPAFNLKCYLTHSEYQFQTKRELLTLRVGESKWQNVTLPSEQFDFEHWPGLAVTCDYQSVYPQSFRSILRFCTQEERRFKICELKEGQK